MLLLLLLFLLILTLLLLLSILLVLRQLGVSQDRRAVDRTSSSGESAVIINADDPFAAVSGWGHEELQQVVTPMLEQEAALLIICANRWDAHHALLFVGSFAP